MRKQGKWNPSRVLIAIGKIGYEPVSAILDIADNSVSAKATKIDISISVSQSQEGKRRRKAFIDGFLIKDNGKGMDEAQLDNALSLGSSNEFYEQDTLSKFGMGMKAAASSLGKKLEIITRKAGENALKAVLDHTIIMEHYEYDLIEPSAEELSEFNDFLGGDDKSGTFIKISEINLQSMPSVAEILEGLKQRIGIVYYYYILGVVENYEKIIFTVGNEQIEPFDPLFVGAISEQNGNLDETNWSGLEPKWITKEQSIQLLDLDETSLDSDSSDTSAIPVAKVEITQLPHPPSVSDQKIMSQKACRDKYMIGAGNYGFYIYRNKRLISWAASLDMVGFDQDLYSFRGRILIDSDSDEVLNIDVTKSKIHLSELAKSQLTPIVQEAKKKSIAAWRTCTTRIAQKDSDEPHNSINEQLDKAGNIVEKDDQIDEDVASTSEKTKLRKRREKTVKSNEATPVEKERLTQSGQRVQYVDVLNNNQLWERAHDPEHGIIVRVNKSHRFVREILDVQTKNPQLIKVLDLFFFALARGEYSLVYKSDHDEDETEKIIADYREYVGNDLSEILKKLNISDVIGGNGIS